MIRSPAGFDGEDRIKRYLDYYQPSYGVMMLSAGQFSPLQLFASGEQGVWYDPSDMTTLFQDSAGTTPVTAVEQPVGLMLDKSKGLALGSEQVANTGNPFTTTTGYSAGGSATISVDTGRLKVSQTTGFTDGVLCALPNNSFSSSTVISFTVDLGSSGLVQIQAGNGNFGNGGVITVNITASGTYSIVTTTITSGASGLTFKAGSASNFFLSRVSVKQLPGNHASQSTSASRPVLRARYNLLTYSEQFDNAAWVKVGCGISSNSTNAPDGTASAETMTCAAGTLVHEIYQNVTLVSGVSYVMSVFAKKNTHNFIQLRHYSGAGGASRYANFDLSTGVLGTVGADATASITDVGNGWYLCKMIATVTGTNSGLDLWIVPASTSSSAAIFTATGTESVYIWGADLRVTNDALNQPSYQRIAAATDYDVVGFKPYLFFDGTDDSMATATINPGSVDKVQVFAGVRKLSDAAIGILAELSASHLSNAGTFTLLPNSSTVGALGNRFAFASRGSAAAATSQLAYSNSAPAPTTQVWVSTGDISGDLNSIRLNGAASGVVATGDQGTGNYGSYPLYIGRRGGSTLPFNGQLYSLIARFSATNLTDATIAQTETWVNGKTGAY